MRAMAAGLGIVIISLGSSFAADAPKPMAASPAATAPSADAAAARHALRIACRKEARDQKLAGEERLDYIKDCMKKAPAPKP